MDSLPKLVWSLVGTALFLGLVYFIFQDNRIFDIILPSNVFGAEAKASVLKARDKVYDIINPVVAPAVSKAKQATGDLYDAAKSQIENLINKTKANALDSVKSAIDEKINNVAADIGLEKKPEAISLNDETKAPDFPLGFTLKVNSPTVFIIKNISKNNKPMSYVVDWGDSVKEEGEVPSSATRRVQHTWIEVGEYSVKITINEMGAKKLFSAYVVVY